MCPSSRKTALMNPKMPWTSWKRSWMLQGRLRSRLWIYSCHSLEKSFDELVPCDMEDMVETIQPDSNLARWRSVENLMGIVAHVKTGD